MCLFALIAMGGPRVLQGDAAQAIELKKSCQAFLVGYTEFKADAFGDLSDISNDVTSLAATLLADPRFEVTVYTQTKGVAQLKPDKGSRLRARFVRSEPDAEAPDSPDEGEGSDKVTPGDSTVEAERFKVATEQWIAAIPPTTQLVIVYLSSHGVVDINGEFKIVVPDSEYEADAEGACKHVTGISYRWLYEALSRCPATVLLAIDCCYAGGADVLDPRDGQNFGESYNRKGNIMVLASSRKDQASKMFPDVKQSLFSFWLNQGLKGQADTQHPKGRVDFDELCRYVKQKVSTFATLIGRADQRQDPVSYCPMGLEPPPMAEVRPFSLNALLQNTAELIDLELRLRTNVEQVCVYEFQPTDGAHAAGLTFPTLRRTIAEQLTEMLGDSVRKHNAYGLIDGDHIAVALRKAAWRAEQPVLRDQFLKSPIDVGQRPVALVTGTIEPCDPSDNRYPTQKWVSLSFKMSFKGRITPFAESGGVAVLSPGQFYQQRPVCVPPVWRPGKPDVGIPGRRISFDSGQTRAIIEEVRETPGHVPPHAVPPRWDGNAGCPFGVRLYVDGIANPLPARWQDGNYHVRFRNGEKFRIVFECKSVPGESFNPEGKVPFAFVRVLVDGRNTLPQPTGLVREGAIMRPAKRNSQEYVIAKQVSLDDARPWLITEPGQYEIAGFVEEKTAGRRPQQSALLNSRSQAGEQEANAVCYRFEASSDESEIIALDPVNRSAIGTMTVAFYKPVLATSIERGMTRVGDPEPMHLEHVRTPYVPGEQFGIYSIRYEVAP